MPVAVRERRGLGRCPGLQELRPLLQASSPSSPWASVPEVLMTEELTFHLSLVSSRQWGWLLCAESLHEG